VGYFTINPFINDGFFDLDYLNKQPAIYENKYLRHIKFKNPLKVIIEGKTNKAAIFKENYVFKNLEKELNITEEELPPQGFM